MFIDSGLNRPKIGFGDGPFSNSNWQHDHYITERKLRRQQKVKKSEKNFDLQDSVEKLADLWVETKICGLKISGILARWTY
jgi:hypothetical protein